MINLKMRATILVSFIAVIVFTQTAIAQERKGDEIIGTWLTADKKGEITIFKEKDRYFGKISAGSGEQKFDIHNPDKSRRSDPLIGLVILKDLQYDAEDKTWENGKVYDPQNGKSYSCNVKLLNSNTLKITGYIGFSWIGRSEEWSRIR